MNKVVFGLIFLLAFFSLTGAEPEFYVWQRQHTPEMQSAVKEFYRKCPGKLYFLAGEIENDGRIIRIPPSKAVDFARAVPVVRIHERNIGRRSPVDLAREIGSLYLPWKATGALQIDFDVPEFRLDFYVDLMRDLREILPDVRFSATVLPCHLNHEKEFRELAAQCDFYVLQVHGLTRRNRGWSIYDHAEAVRAVMRAKTLKLPFKIALPLYCNRIGGQWVKPDLAKVSELAAVCGEVIGFRLGIPGDGSALDLESSLRVCKGQGYAQKLEIRWERKPGGAWHLFIQNRGFFAERVTLSLDFKEPPADMDTFNRARLNGKRNELTLILPPSGMEKPYLWVRTGDSEKPMITLKMRGGNKL